MIYLAIDKDGKAHLFRTKPYRDGECWKCNSTKDIPFPVLPVELSAVSMWLNKTNLSWQDEPIEIYMEPQEKMVSLDKACEYLESALKHDLGYYGAADFADTFRKQMEE
jgi:hypothetical protein